MLWEVEIQPKGPDPERDRVREEYHMLTHTAAGPTLSTQSSNCYLLEGDLSREQGSA
jgi:hypothetical protein